ncbi:M20 family metallopeptidase [Clostridium sp. BSD9I1]|uniref:M20 metallopeptidase family protein n=1 Tax=Clostridium sp. BSD9I1 TaxID=2003589 RepID=UPI0016471552|nr:M20 family metallopeptidase [Clostridium sp. BSD9I1]
MMNEQVEKLIDKYIDEIIEVRRDIHENPELGMNEYRTAKLVAEKLKDIGLDVKESVGDTGVVGLLTGKEDGKTILLRADMDALPIEELTDLPFKSKNSGVMHACGHDAHTAILFGTAKVLNQLKENIKGSVKFAFQPAEECNPEGGANFMIRDGVLENPKIDAAVALHVWDMPLGKVATKKGVIMAQSDRVFIKIKGKSSHGSAPHQGADAIVAASYVVTSLQTIVSRNIDPLDSAVVSIGIMKGGYRENVIADEVYMEGTVRTFNKEMGNFMRKKIEQIMKGICESLGCTYEYEYVYGYPAMYNNEQLTENLIEGLNDSFEHGNVIIVERPASGAEDFAFFSQKVPSTLIWVGCKSDMNKEQCVLHNPNFLLDEKCIKIGIKAMCAAALKFLNQ